METNRRFSVSTLVCSTLLLIVDRNLEWQRRLCVTDARLRENVKYQITADKSKERIAAAANVEAGAVLPVAYEFSALLMNGNDH
jgi:hypothetical protein